MTYDTSTGKVYEELGGATTNRTNNNNNTSTTNNNNTGGGGGGGTGGLDTRNTDRSSYFQVNI